MHSLIPPALLPHARVTALALLGLAAGCSTVENTLSGDKIDYRSASNVKATPLDVPPDLTQLSRDPRYQTGSGTISASTYQASQAAQAAATLPPVVATATATGVATGTAASTGPQSVAISAIDQMRIERAGNERWLVTPMTPEQLWPKLKGFWEQRGFTIASEAADAGVMETDWAENRAKLPQDVIRSTLGRVLDSLYSTSERDKFRVRVERVAGGSEVYISHRGMEEVYTSALRDSTKWQPRPADPQLEAEMLARLMLALAGQVADVKANATANADGSAPKTQAAAVEAIAAKSMGPSGPARARALAGQPGAALQVDENFDRAWRRVGLALDRSGFTVEDRDRSSGLYFVRYVDPSEAGKEEPGFFGRLFSFGKSSKLTGPVRYRVLLQGNGDLTTVSVLNELGAAANDAAAQRITSVLVDELK